MAGYENNYADKCAESSPGYPGVTNADYSGLYAKTTQACSTGSHAQQVNFDPNYVIDQLFTYHPADPSTGQKFETLREAAKYFAKVIANNVPGGPDRTAAIRKVREAVMTANAGISLGGLSL